MPTWNGIPIPEPPQIKIPNSIPQNFNWDSYLADPKGTFNKFKGAREAHRLNWKGYKTTSNSIKRIVGSSPSKKFISAAGKQIRTTKKIADNAKKVQDAFFKKMPGGATPKNSGIAGGQLLGIVLQGGLAAAVIHSILVQNFINDTVDRQFINLNNDLSKNLTLLTTLNSKVKNLDARVNEFNKKISRELDANAKDYAQLNKQTEAIAKNTVEAKKQANNALYETREGRKIVEGKVAEAKKQANDALYETREGRKIVEGKVAEAKKQSNDALYETRGLKTSIDAKIQSINTQISKFNNNVSDAFQKSVNATISKIQSDLAATRTQVNAIKPSQPTDTNSIIANAVAAARALVTPLQSQIGQLTGLVNGVQGQTSQIPVLANSVGNLAQSVGTANAKADAAMNEARNKGVPNLAPLQQQLDEKFNQFVFDNNKALKIRDLQQSNLSKEFDKKFNDFERQSNLTADQRFDEFKKDNDKTLGIVGLTQSNLSKEFDAKFADFKRQSNLTADQRFEEFQQNNKKNLGLISGDLKQVTREVEDNKITITKIDTKLGEQAKVNDSALPKLDQILGILPLIPARAANAIRPDIPTIPQIEAAAATGTCRTTQPGGCMNKALKDNAADITNNNNTNAANILDAVNTGANAALLQGQQTILARLGDQLPGGIGGKLTRFAQWAHLDRALNIITVAATLHNAAMLSNDLGQTLFSLINNVLSIVGLKDAEGQAFDIGSVISKGIEGLIKGAIGEENYKTLDATWKRANRIYQATANLLNSIQSVSASILNALEVVGQWSAKVANALKRFGVVAEDAYSWMNPNVNFQNKFFTGLENATNFVSQVDVVASEVLSIKETVGQIAEQKKELDNSLKETDASKQKAELPEAAKLAQKENESKVASAALPLVENDKEADEDN